VELAEDLVGGVDRVHDAEGVIQVDAVVLEERLLLGELVVVLAVVRRGESAPPSAWCPEIKKERKKDGGKSVRRHQPRGRLRR